MASMTKAQQKAIRTLVRRANRRIERASAGQRSALEYFVQKAVGKNKWSAATKGYTSEQANLLLSQLKKFLTAQSTTKRGWEYTDFEKGIGRHTNQGWIAMKQANVSTAAGTLSTMGYDISEDELAEILKQIDAKDRSEFYRAVNLVQAKKEEKGDKWKGSSKQIREALEEKATAQEALDKAIKARDAKG